MSFRFKNIMEIRIPNQTISRNLSQVYRVTKCCNKPEFSIFSFSKNPHFANYFSSPDYTFVK